MGVPQRYYPHYTYNDWIHWEGRWELIQGIPIAMSPMPVPEHQRVVAAIIGEFWLVLRKNGCNECKVYDSIDFKISEDTILQPDLLIVCGKIHKSYLDFPPVVVVEVLSPSTEERDRNIKYELYEQERVKYYLIVDIKKKTIEVNELINGRYLLKPNLNDYDFQLNPNCSISPDLVAIWRE